MNTASESLIHLQGVNKIFFTEDLETHALESIHLDGTFSYVSTRQYEKVP